MEEGAVIKHNLKKSPITGYWRYARPSVDKKKCVGCGVCVKFCPEACIELTDNLPRRPASQRGEQTGKQLTTNKKSVADIDYCFCKGCGVCARECPAKAIKMEKESVSIKYEI